MKKKRRTEAGAETGNGNAAASAYTPYGYYPGYGYSPPNYGGAWDGAFPYTYMPGLMAPYPQLPYAPYPQTPYAPYPQMPFAPYPQLPYAPYPQTPYAPYPQTPYMPPPMPMPYWGGVW